MGDELDALGVSGRCVVHCDLLGHRADIEGDRLEAHLAGLDLGEVQEVVDDCEEGATRLVDLPKVVVLWLGER